MNYNGINYELKNRNDCLYLVPMFSEKRPYIIKFNCLKDIKDNIKYVGYNPNYPLYSMVILTNNNELYYSDWERNTPDSDGVYVYKNNISSVSVKDYFFTKTCNTCRGFVYRTTDNRIFEYSNSQDKMTAFKLRKIVPE